MKKILTLFFVTIIVAVFVLLFLPTEVQANHAWNNYHWARTSNPFTVRIGNNVSSQWKPYLDGAAYSWNRSSMLESPVVSGGTSPFQCKPTTAHVQVCSAAYGDTGWLGLAQLYVSGDHITKATVKLNDTFFANARFNTPSWRNLVMCQEIGHALGLNHQDENFGNSPLGTCMDYSSNPDPNQKPNMHDYYQLVYIYHYHKDRTVASDTTSLAEVTSLAGENSFNQPSEWGKLVKGGDASLASGGTNQVASYERDFGGGQKLHTIVIHTAK